MLLDLSADLVQRVGEIQRKKALANKTDALKARASKFEKLDQALSAVVRPINLMRARSVAIQLKGNYSGARDYFAKLRKSVSENPQVLVDIENLLGPMQQQVERIAEQSEKSAREAWISDVDQRGKVRVNETVLRALGKIPEFRESVSAVRKAIERRDALKSKLPLNEKEFEEADTIGKEIARTWKAVGSDDIPQSVLDLLHAAGGKALTLESLNDEALNWLRKKKLTKYFLLSLAN